MSTPFPAEASENGTLYLSQARAIYNAYVQIARLSDQIANLDPNTDLSKVAELAFTHGKAYMDLTGGGADAEFKASVRTVFEANGIEWATQNEMVTDLSELRSAVNTYRTWIDLNEPDAKQPAVMEYTMARQGSEQVSIKKALPNATRDQTAVLRTTFI